MPTRYTPELVQTICDQLASGKSLRQICAAPDMPDRHTVRRWVVQYPEFREQYEAARLLWADELFEQIAELSAQARRIAEEAEGKGLNAHATVAALREEIRGLMWVCARLRPDKYGDRISAEVSGLGSKDLIPERAADPDRIAQALLLMIEAPVARTIAAPLARTGIEYSVSDADDVADK
jgi:transposase-like protein